MYADVCGRVLTHTFPPAAHFHSSPLQHPLQHSLPPLAPIHRADAATAPSHRPQHDAAVRLQTSLAHNTNTWGGARLDPQPPPPPPPQQQQQLMPHQQLCHTQPVFQTAAVVSPADEDAVGGGYFGAVTLEPRAVSSPLPLPSQPGSGHATPVGGGGGGSRSGVATLEPRAVSSPLPVPPSTHPPAPEHTHTSAAAPPPAHLRAQVPAVPLFRPSAHDGGGWGGTQSCAQSRSGDGYFSGGTLEPPVPLFRYLRRYFST
jgi:hypothetical protein